MADRRSPPYSHGLDLSKVVPTFTAGALLKAGTSTTPVKTATAGMNFVQLYNSSTATSGSTRGIYNRLYISGAGQTGESLRSFTTVNNVAATTVHGAHISLSCGTTGTISGLGAAVRATLQVPNGNLAGTTCAIQAELWADGASSQNTGTMSLIRVVIDGEATGAAALKDAYFLDLDGSEITAASGGFIDTDKTALTGYGSLRVRVPDGSTKYIPITTGA